VDAVHVPPSEESDDVSQDAADTIRDVEAWLRQERIKKGRG
jgi:hypothetical protein